MTSYTPSQSKAIKFRLSGRRREYASRLADYIDRAGGKIVIDRRDRERVRTAILGDGTDLRLAIDDLHAAGVVDARLAGGHEIVEAVGGVER